MLKKLLFSLIGAILYSRQIIIAQQQGYTLGLQNSIVAIIQQSRNCQPVSLFVGNQSFQFVDVGCLKAGEEAG